MSKIEVNTIDVQCGSTLTLGSSGKTVSLASGSSIGGVGTVSWCTTAKTSPFTATSGNGFFVNTACGAVTVTLPGSPTAGSIVAFKDYSNTWDNNSVTVCRNGSKINGVCQNATLNTESQSVTLIYVDGTKGWQDIQDSTSNVTGTTFISASGGTETTSGNFKIHTFTSSGCFAVSSASNSAPLNDVSFVVVAGGGGGAGDNGAGGGAGGFRENKGSQDSYTASPLNGATPITVSAQTYPITIGAGGSAGAAPAPYNGTSGADSVFTTVTSAGGGRGGTGHTSPSDAGAAGGSGGGGGRKAGGSGAGNTPPVSPAQGFAGGAGPPGTSNCQGSGGGGGATAAGSNGLPTSCSGSGCGGAGAGTGINPASPVGTPGPSPLRFFGGGGGGSLKGGHPQPQSTGGVGGGGNYVRGVGSTAGTTNTGGGGAGDAAGGSGIVIIRYKFQ